MLFQGSESTESLKLPKLIPAIATAGSANRDVTGVTSIMSIAVEVSYNQKGEILCMWSKKCSANPLMVCPIHS